MACQFDSRKPELQMNLRRLYRQATPADLALGTAWYPAAHRIVCEWSESYGLSIATVACIIAALSPQVEWSRNLIMADDILADRYPSIGGIHKNIQKAHNIRNHRADTMLPYFPGGPKVASFAKNLAGDMDYVTIDGHAAQAALNNVRSTVALTWGPYTVFAGCYDTVGRSLGHSPAEFQAIIWHIWKRQYPRVNKLALRKRWEAMGEY